MHPLTIQRTKLTSGKSKKKGAIKVMKKRIILVTLILTSLIYASQSYAYLSSRYDITSHSLKGIFINNPDGTENRKAEIVYKANKCLNKYKNFDEIPGYVSDIDLSSKGGTYIQKQLITYKEYFDLGIDDLFRNDIDPNRMVWVFRSKFNKTHYIEGNPIEKAIVTTVFDAETGDPISLVVTSDDPHGLDNVKK